MNITEFGQVREILGQPAPLARKKIYTHLNDRMIEFIRHAPLVMVSTLDADGFPSISPKGDHPGFVQVEDAAHLLIPERKGNKLAFSFANIVAGSKIGLLFLVPGTNEVLRIHGIPELIHDPELNRALSSQSQQSLLVTRVAVTSCYFHCGKALIRSCAWSQDAQQAPIKISFGAEIANNQGLSGEVIADIDAGVAQRYQTDI